MKTFLLKISTSIEGRNPYYCALLHMHMPIMMDNKFAIVCYGRSLSSSQKHLHMKFEFTCKRHLFLGFAFSNEPSINTRLFVSSLTAPIFKIFPSHIVTPYASLTFWEM